jgi:hypothetical protein
MHTPAISVSLYAAILVCGFTAIAAPALAGDMPAGIGDAHPLAGATLASGGAWENFKNIRQGKPAAGEPAEEATAAPASPAPAPASKQAATKPAQTVSTPAPAPKPAAPAPAAKPAAAPPQQQRHAAESKPDPALITAPAQPTEQGGNWKFYAGSMRIHANNFYDPHGVDFKWAYSLVEPLPSTPRVVVHMHGSGGGVGSMGVFGPSSLGDIEVRTQDAEAYNYDWREWWTFGSNGKPYPGRRIAATLQYLTARYKLDLSTRGIVLMGPSMGGAGAVIQTMILPSPWREKIAYSSARAGVIMPRLIAKRDPRQYITFPPDNAQNKALWDSIDFAVQAASDPVVRNMHYRHAFSSDDQFSAGVHFANTQLQFVNLVERYKISGAFGWVKIGHGSYEEGVGIPDMSEFEVPEQDVSLDRALPAITQSTGNYPLRAEDRANGVLYPRGHYNMGITWAHARIVDTPAQIVFPLKYLRRVNIGGGVPDQPERITISVTPRRAKNFKLVDGEPLKWSWAAGAMSGVATVIGDTVTIDGIPLVSGEPYKMLRIYR